MKGMFLPIRDVVAPAASSVGDARSDASIIAPPLWPSLVRNGPRGGARNYVPKNYRERARKKCGPADVQDVSISARNAQVHIDPFGSSKRIKKDLRCVCVEAVPFRKRTLWACHSGVPAPAAAASTRAAAARIAARA